MGGVVDMNGSMMHESRARVGMTMQPFNKVRKRIFTNSMIDRDARLMLAESMHLSKLFLHAHVWEVEDVGAI
eukprot:2857431-Lingulodinium_polyedra.AAC.1